MEYGSPPRFQIFVYKEGEVLARSAPPPLKRAFFGGAPIAQAGGWVDAHARARVVSDNSGCFGRARVVSDSSGRCGRARVVSACLGLFLGAPALFRVVSGCS